ncbi:MAG: sensor histidine kinase [Ginsengibacter sp.]
MFKQIFTVFLIVIIHSDVFTQSSDRSIKLINADLKKSVNNTEKANLLLELALAYVHKPGEEKSDLDSALLLIRQAENINIKILHDKIIEAKTYFVYSNAYREKGDTATGHPYINKSISLYETLLFPEDLGNAYLEIKNYYGDAGREDIPKVIEYLNKALNQFNLSANKERQADVLKNMADYNIILRKYGEALTELNESLNIYTSIHKKDLQGVYDLLNLVHVNLGDYPTAIKYGLLAEKTALQQKDSTMMLCTIYYRLALVYNKWYNYNSAEAAEYYRKALDIALKHKDYESIQFITVSLCYQFVKLHTPEKAIKLIYDLGKNVQLNNWADSLYVFSSYIEVYREAKQLNKAKIYADYLTSILSDTSKDLMNEQPDLAYKGLVDYFISDHEYQLAQKYATINLSFCKKNTNKAIIATAYHYKSRADSAVGDFKSALDNYKAEININDSLFNDNKAFQFAQMQVAFNTKQKEDSLKINQQNMQLLSAQNKVDLKRAALTRNIIIISALSLLIILLIGYQLKQNNNRKLQAQQKEISNKNEVLQQTVSEKNKLIEEKEWLVKEIHHRVKNNLQIVISLLNTQSKYLDNKEAIEAISESRHRMQAMSLIHQKLYQSENTTSVNMQSYITELSDYLKTSFNSGREINFIIDVDAIELDISQAIPVGLILNEAITNAIKYAFKAREAGAIQIKMKENSSDKVVLEIKDNGIGLPVNFDLKNSTSMGMRLINGLAKQINAAFTLEGRHGVRMELVFIADLKLKVLS